MPADNPAATAINTPCTISAEIVNVRVAHPHSAVANPGFRRRLVRRFGVPRRCPGAGFTFPDAHT
jgi:hypothetical protein